MKPYHRTKKYLGFLRCPLWQGFSLAKGLTARRFALHNHLDLANV